MRAFQGHALAAFRLLCTAAAARTRPAMAAPSWGSDGPHISAALTAASGTRMSIRSSSAPPTLRQYL